MGPGSRFALQALADSTGLEPAVPEAINLGAAPGSSESMVTELVPTLVGPNVAFRLTSLRHNVQEEGIEPPTFGHMMYRRSTAELFLQSLRVESNRPSSQLELGALTLSYEGMAELRRAKHRAASSGYPNSPQLHKELLHEGQRTGYLSDRGAIGRRADADGHRLAGEWASILDDELVRQ